MKKIRTGWLWAVLGVGVLGAGAFVFNEDGRDGGMTTQPLSPAQVPLAQPPASPAAPAVPAPELTSVQREVYEILDPAGKEAVAVFLANTPGPLDNYLLKLEGITNVGNARYNAPNRESWQEALPIARVLEQGMCDCAQRNWLNQFIATGEAGLSGDLDAYHQHGETMASISRYNGDPVVIR